MAWEYRDVTIPAHVQAKLADGKLSPTDLLLILAINSLTKHIDDGSGKGCYATNAYLAAASHANSGNYVSERLRRLSKLGYVLIIEHEGKRHLELEWGRTAEEREELAGEYGDLLRTAHQMALKRIQKKAKGVTIDRKEGVTIDRNQSIRDNIKGKTKEGGSAAAATPPGDSTPPIKLRYNGELLAKNGCRPPVKFKDTVKPEYLDAAKKLRLAVREAGERFDGSDPGNADHFRLLVEHDKLPDVLRVLRLFCKHYHDRRQLRLPQIGNAGQFRKRYDWIRDRLIELELLTAPKTAEEATHDAVDEYFDTPGPKNLRTFYELSAKKGRIQ